MLPVEINQKLKEWVIGQEETLKFVSVALFKHTSGEKFGNLLMIGNSGTGKTTVMKAIEELYRQAEFFKKFRVVIRMNANSLADEEGGTANAQPLFDRLEARARQILGPDAPLEDVKANIEHATVCVDEIDKISGLVGGKPNVQGINIQYSLLTLMEGERYLYNTRHLENGKWEPVQLDIDTGNMLFICGGAFEKLYDMVHSRVFEEGKKALTKTVVKADGTVTFMDIFELRDHLQQEDLFLFGMQPQFIARFDNALVLEDLKPHHLKTIFLSVPNAIFPASRNFFRKFDVDLEISEGAVGMICETAYRFKRVGARALKEVYGRVIKPFEYDPFQAEGIVKTDEGHRLTLNEEIVKRAVKNL